MAEAPTLGELTNIKSEPTINPGVVLDSRDAVHSLNQSAQFNAEMKQRKYTQGLEMLKGIYQDLGAIQETPVMQEDRPILNKKMGEVLGIIAEDPHAALGGPKFGDIQKRIGELRTLSTNSKQDNIYNDFHEKTLQSDPELDTPGNRDKVKTFTSQPVGQRQKFLLDTPVKFDPEVAMGNILKQRNVAIPTAGTTFDGPNNEWMIKETGTTYQREPALKMWNQGYQTGTDANNQPIKKWAQEQFDKIKNDPSQLQKFGNPKDAQEFYNKLGEMMFGSSQDIVGEKSSTRTANPYNLLGMRQNASLYMEAIKEGNREKLAAVKKNLELKGAPENANFLVRQYSNVLGNVTGEQNTVETSKGKFEKEDILDVPAPILKQYAEAQKETLKEGHSFDPVTETIVEGNLPDLTTRTSGGNLRLTFYKRYAKTDKIPKGSSPGDVVKDANGQKVIDKTGVVPRRNLMATLGKGVVQPKIFAASIDEADQVLRDQPNSVIDKINSGDEDGTAMGAAKESKRDAKKKTYSLNGKPFTMEQVEKGAKKYKMSVDDYIKQTGIQ